MRTPRFSLAAALILAAAAPIMTPGLAHAQPAAAKTPDAQTMEKAKECFAKGKQLYDQGDKQGSVEQFKEAFRLTRNPLLLYNIGMVLDELKDKSVALHYYEKFLSDAPDDDRTRENRGFATERIKVLKKEVAEEDSAAATAEKAKAEADAKAKAEAEAKAKAEAEARKAQSVKEFTHAVVSEAPPGVPLDLVVKIPIDTDWVITMFYRSAGEDEFRSLRMKPRFTEIVGRIPPEAVTGQSLHYYIEARNQKGDLVASSGRASSPNIIYLDPEAKPHFYRDLEGKENALPSSEGGDMATTAVPIPTDRGARKSSPRNIAKWATTGTAAALLTTSLVIYIVAMDKASQMESLAYGSTDGCGNAAPPCGYFDAQARALQSDGHTLEKWTTATMAVGAASAVAAGVLWYFDIRDLQKRPATGAEPGVGASASSGTRVMGMPIVGDGFVGGTAVIEF